MSPPPLILASKSASRQTLLQNAGVPFEAAAAEIDERALQDASGSADSRAIALLLAKAKAADVAARHPGRWVLGADQTLALGPRLFNKPAGREQAQAQLRALAGATHHLQSALAVMRDGELLFEHVAEARMTMRHLSEAEITAYLDTAGDAVTTSVGCYQVEGLGIRLFERIQGDHFTILGLPLVPLLDFLRQQRLLAF